MKITRIILILITTIMLASVLTACGTENKANESGSSLVTTSEVAPIEETQLEVTETVVATTAVPTSTPTLEPKQNMKACDENGLFLTESVFISTLLDVLNGKSTFMDSSDSYFVDKGDVAYAMYKNGSYTTQMIT